MDSFGNEAKKNFWSINRNLREKRENIRIKNPKSIYLGVIGIVFCLCALALAWPVAWLICKCFVWAFSGVMLVLIGNLLLIAIGCMLPIMYIRFILTPCILYPIHQLILNRHGIGWVGLIFAIATILVGSVGVFILVFKIAI